MQFFEDEVEEHKKELFEYQKELDKSKQSKKDLRNDAEIACVECDKLNNKSVHAEVRCDALTKKLKNKSCRVIFEIQEEEHVEVEDTKKETHNEHVLDVRMEYFEECRLDLESEDGKYLLCHMFDG